MKLPILLLLLFLPLFSFTQELTGKIQDDEGNGVEFANVILMDANTKEIVDVVASDLEGKYKFMDLEIKTYLIKVSMLGFEDEISDPINMRYYDGKSLDFIIQENVQMVEEVEVVSTRPKIVQRGGKTVVTLNNSLQSGQNLSGILKRVPGVIVSNRNVRVGASGSVTILINGRSTNYMDMETLLNDMPAENIDRIELVHQPDATYEASGSGPIINIVTSKNKLEGTNGNITSMLGHSDGWVHAVGLNFNSFQKNMNISGNISQRQSGWTETTDISRTIGDEAYTQYSRNPYRPSSYRATLDFDYYLHTNHTLGIRLNHVNAAETWRGDGRVGITSPLANSLLTTRTDAIEDWLYWNVNPFYEWRWNPDDFLRFDARYIDYRPKDQFAITRLDNSTIDYNNPITVQNGVNQTSSFKLDFQKKLDEHIVKLGGQYDIAALDNKLQNFVNNLSEPNPNLDDHFIIDETIAALYSQYELNTDRFNFSTGLRWENSNTIGTSVTLDSTVNRNINRLFPNASLMYQIDSIFGVGTAYSYRIQRPGYYSLNPFRVFYDPLTTDSGNPNLTPEFTHSLQLNFLYFKRPFFRLEYKQTNNALFEAAFQNDVTGETTRRMINIDSRESFGASLYFPLDFIPHTTGIGGIMVNYIRNQSNMPEFIYDQSKWGWTFYGQIEVSLPAKLKLETTAWMGTGTLQGMIDVDWFAGGYAELSRSFLEDRLLISLEIEDFITRGNIGSIVYQNINASFNNRPNFYATYLRMKYKFGSNYVKAKELKKRDSDGLERLQN